VVDVCMNAFSVSKHSALKKFTISGTFALYSLTLAWLQWQHKYSINSLSQYSRNLQ